MSARAYWQRGDVVVLRYVETPTSARMLHAINGPEVGLNSGGVPFLVNGRVTTVGSWPYRVVEDGPERTVLCSPHATPHQRWVIDEQRYLPEPFLTRGTEIRILYPGKPYDITLFFEPPDGLPPLFTALFAGEGLRPGWREKRKATGGYPVTDTQPKPGRFWGWYVNIDLPFRRTTAGFDITDMTLDIVVRADRSWYWKDEDELALAVANGGLTQSRADEVRRAGEEVVALVESGASPFDDEWTRWRPPEDWAIETIPDGWQKLPALVDD